MSQGVFDAYAAYYDLLNRDKDYEAEAVYVDGLLQRYHPGVKHLLELGCGTGIHAEQFARRGYHVTGVDRSAEMVRKAHARRAGLPADIAARLEFNVGDIATLRLGRQFDAVISLFHVFSYQTSNAALRGAFLSSAAHLAPGGLLCFDYWHGPAVLSQRPEVRMRRIEDERCFVQRLAEPELRVSENLVRVNYSIEVTSKADASRVAIEESHEMRYLFVPEIEWMAAPEFGPCAHRAWMGDSTPNLADWGAVSVLERRG
jgi:SAM-dependent methyltransferase